MTLDEFIAVNVMGLKKTNDVWRGEAGSGHIYTVEPFRLPRKLHSRGRWIPGFPHWSPTTNIDQAHMALEKFPEWEIFRDHDYSALSIPMTLMITGQKRMMDHCPKQSA